MAIEEAEQQIITRLYHNTARAHFNAYALQGTRFGKRVIYGGHVISVARALSFNGLENAVRVLAFNGGTHSNPTFAGDTLFAWTDVLERIDLGRDDAGALRLRLVRDQGCGPKHRGRAVQGRGRQRPRALPPERRAGPRLHRADAEGPLRPPGATARSLPMTATEVDALTTARSLVDAAQGVVDAAVAHAAAVTEGGAAIDDHQVHTERVAYLATQVRAAHELAAAAERLREAGRRDEQTEGAALVYAAEAAHAVRSAVEAAWDDFGVGDAASAFDAPEVRSAIRAGLDESRVRELGRRAIASLGVNNLDLDDEVAALTRDAARDFARNEVMPLAQQIHREDLLVPDELIAKFAAQGFFGSSIPEEYGGTGMGYLPMVVMTEELSAASLGAAGSLHTRPEILAHALLTGGTDEQKQHWLPKIAAGEILVAIGVTEPDVGSDNANLQTRAPRPTRSTACAAGGSTARRRGARSPAAPT